MFKQIISSATVALATLSGAAYAADEMAADNHHNVAIATCLNYSDYGTTLEAVVEDGVGGTLVWMLDPQEDLWMCNANEEGDIYIYNHVKNDLMLGYGYEMFMYYSDLNYNVAFENEYYDYYNFYIAISLCEILLNNFFDSNLEFYLITDDGLGDYLVWMEDDLDRIWACNASESGEIFVFEEIYKTLEPRIEA